MVTQTPFRWGLVGLGRIADGEIAPAVAALRGHQLAAVVSRDQEKAARFAAAHGAAVATTSYERVLADPSIDAVYLATPNAFHAEQVTAAAAAGKHVMCDKPLATNVPDARNAVGACRDAGVRLGIMFESRRFEGMAEAAEAVCHGSIGRVALAHVEMSAGRSLPTGWRTDPALAGLGTLNNIGVHAFDMLRYLLGSEVAEVSAMVDREGGMAVDTSAVVLLRFASGTLAYVNANQSVPHPRNDVVLYGTEGRILGQDLSRPNKEGSLVVTTPEGVRQHACSTAGGYRSTLAAFAAAVRDGGEPTPSGYDGLRSVQLIAAIAAAIDTGRVVAPET